MLGKPCVHPTAWGEYLENRKGETAVAKANTGWDGSEVDFTEVLSVWLCFVFPWEC